MDIITAAIGLNLRCLHQSQDDVYIVGLDGVTGGFTQAFFATAQTAVDDLIAFLRIVDDANRGH